MSRVLVTGAAGVIGRYLLRGLPEHGWTVRAFDRLPAPEPFREIDWVRAELADEAQLAYAMTGVEAVVHLAGYKTEAPFEELIEPNIHGVYRVFEAARVAGVERLVYASSCHAVGYAPRSDHVPDGLLPRPDTFYGVTKVFGEALGSFYADRHGMRVACLRLGTCMDKPASVRHLGTWLSPGDMVRLADACLRAPKLTYTIVFGVSANTRRWWDLTAARELGYEPIDDAERFADEILGKRGPLPADHPDARYLGGSFVTL